MTDAEEMDRRARACQMVADQIKTVYAGTRSSKGFVPKRISASSLVSKTAEQVAMDLIEAHRLHATGEIPPYTGSYHSFWGDMASTRVLEGEEVNVDAAEFWPTTDLEDGWLLSMHPDGAKIVEVDDRKYVVFIEQKNYARPDDKRRIIAARQGALYLAASRAMVKTTGGCVIGADPNYERPCKPLEWHGELLPAGVVRSICSPQPPGEATPIAFSDEELDAHLEQMVLKAKHVKAAVEAEDLDYARKWDSDHPEEFQVAQPTPEEAEFKRLVEEYDQIRATMEDLEARKKFLRQSFLEMAMKNPENRVSVDGFSVKISWRAPSPKLDVALMRSDGVYDRYLKPSGSKTPALYVTTPQSDAE